MDFSRLTDPDAYKQALAGLLRRGEEVTDFVATAPEKAGQAILEGHEKNKALQAQAFANPNRPFQVTNQQAMGELGDRMLAGPLSVAPVGMIAYHGTPHLIKDKFDISKVGTGEGAQAYGHGIYFAEAKPVAEEYARELGAKISVDGKPLMQQGKIVGSTGNTELDDFLVANLGDVKATRKDLLQSIKEVRPTNPEGAKDYQKLLADLRKTSVGTQNTGNLYKVDIPDEYIPKMLDWDKPLSQQTKDVQDILRKINPNFKDSLLGREILESLSKPSKMAEDSPMWQVLKDNPNMTPQQAFAKYANKQGIKGVRYLDQGSRSSKITNTPLTQLDAKIDILKKDIDSGLGNKDVMERKLKNLMDERARTTNQTSNFVVFDPSDVKLLERNNQPISRKELLQQQIDKIE